MVRMYVYESTLCTVLRCMCVLLLDVKCVYKICTYTYIILYVDTYRMYVYVQVHLVYNMG